MTPKGDTSEPALPTAVTVGNFDGVHLGHRAIIQAARTAVGALSGTPGRVVAEVFEPHPRSVLAGGRAPARITAFERRAALLRGAGVDHVAQLAPTPAILGMSPESFVQRIVDRWSPRVWVEGEDFRFGHRRAGDLDLLASLGKQHGFSVQVIDPVSSVLSDERATEVSSTLVRGLIELGRVSDASRVLGDSFAVTGTVVKGDQRGRSIGVPTANVDPDCMLPAHGVYAGAATSPDGTVYPAAVHVGPRATFGDDRTVLEAHLIGWDGPFGQSADDPVGYNWQISVELNAFLRDVVRFDTVHAIRAQLGRDIERAIQHFQRVGSPHVRVGAQETIQI